MTSMNEINPCDTCPRNYRPADFEEAGTAALAFMIDNACESSECVSTLDAEQRKLATEFLYWESAGSEDPDAVGAVGACGRTIGRDACSDWKLSKDAKEIVNRGEK